MEAIQLDDPVDERDLEAILSFIPRFQRIPPDDVVIESPGRLLGMEGDKITLAMHGEYHPLVEEFQQALYLHHIVRDFDWGKWQPRALVIYKNPNLLDRATQKTCIKLLTLHARKDRFVDGHFAAMISCGHIQAVLNRMQAIRNRTVARRSQKEKR